MTLLTIQLKLLQRLTQHAKVPSKEIAVISTTHTFTRTIALRWICWSFEQADAVYLAQIYGSCEVDHGDVKVEDFAAKINKLTVVVHLLTMTMLFMSLLDWDIQLTNVVLKSHKAFKTHYVIY